MIFCAIFLLLTTTNTLASADVIFLNSSNWHRSFDGEWFIEFFAPWCPACRQFSVTWDQLSKSSDVEAQIAAVDVTENPVLSFLFFVRQLPTIFHAKDGVFRIYNGSRALEDLRNFLANELYTQHDPIPWFYSPSSFHMGIFFQIMELGMTVTNVHQYLLDSGYSNWASLLIIASGTIMLGLVLGTVLVIVFDFIIPLHPQAVRLFGNRSKAAPREDSQSEKKDDIDEKTIEVVHRQSVDGSGEHQDIEDVVDVRKRTHD